MIRSLARWFLRAELVAEYRRGVVDAERAMGTTLCELGDTLRSQEGSFTIRNVPWDEWEEKHGS